MLDIIASIALGSLYTAVAGVLTSYAPISPRTRFSLLGGLGLWVVFVGFIAAYGGFLPGTTGPVPAVVLAFGAMLGAGLLAWFLIPRFRDALLAIPLPALIGINTIRVLGGFFVMLYAAGRQSAPFAPSAGWGDVGVAIVAVPLAFAAARRAVSARWIGLWNALGVLDLIAALTLGFLSAPGTPFQVFADGPGTTVIGTLPWVLIPAVFVPTFLIIHLTVAAKIHRDKQELSRVGIPRLPARAALVR